MNVFMRVLFLVFMFLRFALLVQPYPMFVRFEYVGVEYDVVSTDSFISVQSKEHVALKYPIPWECDRRTIKAVKRTPYITLRMECEEPKTVVYDSIVLNDNIIHTDIYSNVILPTSSPPSVDKSSTNFQSYRSFPI